MICISIDEIPLREAIHFNVESLQGYINYGQYSGMWPKATGVLVIKIVALN